jgi:hypothetical protein
MSKFELPGVYTRSWVSRLNSFYSQTFPTVSNWLTFNFDYFLIGPNVTILNTPLSLAASDLTMFPVPLLVLTPTRVLPVFLNVRA